MEAVHPSVMSTTSPETSRGGELQTIVDDVYAKYEPLTDGRVATYIPELSLVEPDAFGVCLVTTEGQVFAAGDCDRPFTIQSISKPFTFGMALEELGYDTVMRHVGVEPSGDPFNSIELQHHTNRPFNQMLNSCAITGHRPPPRDSW
jgi:glutaminase